MGQIHMTEAELARDLHSILERVREGSQVVVERDNQPLAIIHPAPSPVGRLLSESIAVARQQENERGYTVVLDADFAADVEEIARNRQPWNPTAWE